MAKSIAMLPPSVQPRDAEVERVIDSPIPQIAIIFKVPNGTVCMRIADVNCYQLMRAMNDVLFSVEE